MAGDLEIRRAAEPLAPARAGDRALTGYAVVWGSRSGDLGGFIEEIRAGAFADTLAGGGDVFALWDHDRRAILGRLSAGTLRLTEDSRGLRFDLELPDTGPGRDAAELVRRGDVTGASFGFRAVAAEWDMRARPPLRTVTAAELREITITPTPAYADTTVALRSLATQGADWQARRRRYLKARAGRAGAA